jgi:hypothetical protein
MGFCVEQDAALASSPGPRPSPSQNGLPLSAAGSSDDAGDADGGGSSERDGAVRASCAAAVTCYDGPSKTVGVGRCRAGTQACVNGVLGSCTGSVGPRPETCDNEGADDDCNGVADDMPGRGEACTLTGDAAACGGGRRVCRAGTQTLGCVAEKPALAEVCNGADDDCDGKSDEDFDMQSDPAHCGRCDLACAAGKACCAGVCVATTGGAADCGSCGSGPACTGGSKCCGGQCLDLTSDAANCGVCGKSCKSGESCCGGACVDTGSNAQHCGRCGTVCGDGSMAGCCDGVCTNLRSNENCGTCGNACGFLMGLLCSCVEEDGQTRCRAALFDLCI